MFRVAFSRLLVAALFVCASTWGQTSKERFWIASLLPEGAQIIELANLKAPAGGNRLLVLWMHHPVKSVRPPSEQKQTCSDWMFGDHWYGDTMLSLLDGSTRKLINTVDLGEVAIPFYVPSGVFFVPAPDKNKEGVPTVVRLRDLTGQGLAAQFVLFRYEACGITSGTVVGYSPARDRAVQYDVESQDGSGDSRVDAWITQVFSHEPTSPGYWNFTWDPGHGADGNLHEEVRFDAARQLFVRRSTEVPR